MRHLLLLAIIMISVSACNNSGEKKGSGEGDTAMTTAKTAVSTVKPTKEAIEGTWDFTYILDDTEAQRLSTEPNDFILTSTSRGITVYDLSGKSNSEGEVAMNMGLKGETNSITLSFHFANSGKWELRGDTLIEILNKMSYDPTDDITKEFLRKMPSFAERLQNPGADTSINTIMQLTKDMIELKDQKTLSVDRGFRRQ